MESLNKLALVVSLFTFFVLCASVKAQENKKPSDAEFKREVPELTKFHEVVYKIWHTAWPEKDIAMLKELLPEVEHLGGELCKAELPGILREKKSVWTKSTEQMKTILADYRLAANGRDSEKLLKAAEQLHAQYEAMVRVIRPAMKEVDEFHSALYPLYHYYMPQKDEGKIRLSVALLIEKMTALSKASLPAKMKDKTTAFNEARSRLGESLKSLEQVLTSSNSVEIDQHINTVHSRYEDLNKIFD